MYSKTHLRFKAHQFNLVLWVLRGSRIQFLHIQYAPIFGCPLDQRNSERRGAAAGAWMHRNAQAMQDVFRKGVNERASGAIGFLE